MTSSTTESVRPAPNFKAAGLNSCTIIEKLLLFLEMYKGIERNSFFEALAVTCIAFCCLTWGVINEVNRCSVQVCIGLISTAVIILGASMLIEAFVIRKARHTTLLCACRRRFKRKCRTIKTSNGFQRKLIVYLICWHSVGGNAWAEEHVTFRKPQGQIDLASHAPSAKHEQKTAAVPHVLQRGESEKFFNHGTSPVWSFERNTHNLTRHESNADDVSQMQQFSAAHRHESPPAIRQRMQAVWQQRELRRQLVEQTTIVRGEDEICTEIEGLVARSHGNFCVMMHAIAEVHVGSRRIVHKIQHGDSFLDFLGHVRMIWSDTISFEFQVSICYAEPQPPPFQTQGQDCLHLLIDLVHQHEKLPNLVVVSFVEDGWELSEPQFRTVRLPHVYDANMIYEAVDLAQTCENVQELCSCFTGLQRCPTSFPLLNREALTFQVEVMSMFERRCEASSGALSGSQDANETDDSSLMMSHPPELLRNRNAVFVYRLGTEEPIFIQVTPYQGAEARQRILDCLGRARANERNRYPTILLHLVHPLPEDLQNRDLDAYIQESHFERVQGKVIILLDVEIYDNTKPAGRRPSVEWREVRYVEKLASRAEFITEIGAAPFCTGEDRCLIHAGGKAWRRQDSSKWELQNVFIVVRMLNLRPEIPFCQQWQQAENGIPVEAMRIHGPAQQSREPREEISSESYDSSDSVDLMQRGFVTRPSFSDEAKGKLPPPGNGKTVSFDSKVMVSQGEHRFVYHDITIANKYLFDFCASSSPEEENNSFVERLIKSMKHQDEQDLNCQKYRKPVQLCLQSMLPPLKPPVTIKLDEVIPEQGNCNEQCLLPVIEECNDGSKAALPDNILPISTPCAVPTEDPQELHAHDSFDEKIVSCPGIEQLYQQVTRENNIILQKDIPMVEMFDSCWLEQIPATADGNEVFNHIAIYTDGSKLWSCQKGREAAAWACVFFGHTQEGKVKFLGSLAHEVIMDRDDPGCTGADANDNDVAEGEAIIWAALWSLQSKHVHDGASVEIVSDSLSKINFSQGYWGNRNNPQHYVLYGLVTALQQRTCLVMEWTRAHRGNPYNELADHIAKTTARFDDQTDWLVDDYFIMNYGDSLAWLWAVFRSEHHRDCPRMTSDDSLAFLCPQVENGEQIEINKKYEQAQNIEAKLTFNFATFNIHTLKGGDRGMQRQEIILQLIKQKKISVMALQETRRKTQKEWQKERIFAFSSAAHQGVGGVDLIFNANEPFFESACEKRSFARSDFMVLFADNQALAVRMKTKEQELVFLAAHAPHSLADEEKKEAFWQGLSERLKSNTAPVIALIDSNAKMGQQTSHFVGSAAGERANANTPYFNKFLEENLLFLPATFESNLEDPDMPQGTWYHRAGLSRLDFICLPYPWKQGSCRTSVQDVEMAREHKDHRMVMAKLNISIQTKPSEQKKKPKPDREAMSTPDGQNMIRAEAEWFNSGVDMKPYGSPDQVLQRYTDFVACRSIQLFPKAKETSRQTWLSEYTWQGLGRLKKLRRYVHQSKRMQKMAILRQIFQSWKKSDTPLPDPGWLKTVHTNRAFAELQIQHISANVRVNLRQDEAGFLAECAKKFEERSANSQGSDLWKVLRTALPKFKERSKNRALRFVETYEGLEKHFAKTEDAESMTNAELAKKAAVRSKQALQVMKAMDIEIMHLPTLQEFEAALRRIKKGKTGFGEVWPEWVRADPRQAALALFPVCSSFFLFAQQPLILKGGNYYPLYKRKGPMSSPESFRAILLSSFIGKALTHVLRGRMAGFVHRVLQPFQIGGIRKQRTQFAAQALALTRESPADRKISQVTLFFDLRAAFYRTPKSAVVSNVLGFEDFQVDEDLAISATLQESACERAQMPPQLQAAAQESLSYSWFALAADGMEVQDHWIPGKGTRPGDPNADLAFTFVMSTVLNGFCDDTQDKRMKLVTTEGKEVSLPPVTWVDDVALVLEDSSPFGLIQKTRDVMASMHRRTKEMGLELNLQSGKTEALFRFQGHGSSKASRYLQRELHQKIVFAEEEGKELSIGTTNKYLHLGSMQSTSMAGMAEVQHRIARAHEAYRSVKRKILENEALEYPKRCSLAQSLIFSRLFHSAEIWPALHPKVERRLHAFMMRVFRTIARMLSKGTEQKFSDAEVQAKIICIKPEWFIRMQRMRYFGKVIQEAPTLLIELLARQDKESPFSWLELVRRDISWMLDSGHLQGDRPHGDQIYHWWRKAAEMGKAWDHAVVRATQDFAHEAHLRAKQGLQAARGEVINEISQELIGFQCHVCKAVLYGSTALAVHLHKKHSIFPSIRGYIESTTCCSCLRRYHSLQRVRQHLQFSSRCRKHLFEVYFPHEAQAVADEVQAGLDFRVPWIREEGPLLPSREQWLQAVPGKVLPRTLADDIALKACLELCQDAADHEEVGISLDTVFEPM